MRIVTVRFTRKGRTLATVRRYERDERGSLVVHGHSLDAPGFHPIQTVREALRFEEFEWVAYARRVRPQR